MTAGAQGRLVAMQQGGAQQLGAARANLIFSTGPFWGVLLAWIINRESISGQQVIAGTLMLVALVSLHAERHGHRHTHETLIHRHWHRHDDGHHEHSRPGSSRLGRPHSRAHPRARHSLAPTPPGSTSQTSALTFARARPASLEGGDEALP